jgi:hypothetical protein
MILKVTAPVTNALILHTVGRIAKIMWEHVVTLRTQNTLFYN